MAMIELNRTVNPLFAAWREGVVCAENYQAISQCTDEELLAVGEDRKCFLHHLMDVRGMAVRQKRIIFYLTLRNLHAKNIAGFVEYAKKQLPEEEGVRDFGLCCLHNVDAINQTIPKPLEGAAPNPNTLLHLLCRQGVSDVIPRMLEHSDPNYCNAVGVQGPPMGYAFFALKEVLDNPGDRKKYTEVVQRLLASTKTDPNARERVGERKYFFVLSVEWRLEAIVGAFLARADLCTEALRAGESAALRIKAVDIGKLIQVELEKRGIIPLEEVQSATGSNKRQREEGGDPSVKHQRLGLLADACASALFLEPDPRENLYALLVEKVKKRDDPGAVAMLSDSALLSFMTPRMRGECAKESILKGCPKTLRRLIAQPIEIDKPLLLFAIGQKDREMVDILLDCNIHRSYLPSMHEDVLREAISSWETLLPQLLERGIRLEENPEIKPGQLSPLGVAIRLQRLGAAELLLQRGAVINERYTQEPPLHIACRSGNLNALNLLLQKPSIDLGLLSRDQKTPLQMAISCPYKDVAIRLLNHPQFAKTTDGIRQVPSLLLRGRGYLVAALQTGHVAAALRMIHLGVDVNESVPQGRVTPLTAVVGASEALDKVSLNLLFTALVGAGANPLAYNLNGYNPFHVAIQQRKIEAVSLFRQYCPAVLSSLTVRERGNGLHVAVETGAKNIVQLVYFALRQEALSQKNWEGRTPFELAVFLYGASHEISVMLYAIVRAVQSR